MIEVHIPFMQRFCYYMLIGRKTVTSRTRRYGNPGDIFSAFGARFEIKSIRLMKLDEVALLHWANEGVESIEEFKTLWAALHPHKGYNGEQLVYLHCFKRISGINPHD